MLFYKLKIKGSTLEPTESINFLCVIKMQESKRCLKKICLQVITEKAKQLQNF